MASFFRLPWKIVCDVFVLCLLLRSIIENLYFQKNYASVVVSILKIQFSFDLLLVSQLGLMKSCRYAKTRINIM